MVIQVIFSLLFLLCMPSLFCSQGLVVNQTVQVTSESFRYGDDMPKKYTCKGENKSPQLQWNEIEGAQSYLLIVEDPDTVQGTYIHWLLFNIPSKITELPENVLASQIGAIDGTNSAGKQEYTGPCPPSGVHRYFFTIYALKSVSNLNSNATVNDIKKEMEEHILAQGSLMCIFSK